jgi:hypothetical protein
MSQGAIGVTNPSYMPAGLCDLPALAQTEAGFGLTSFIYNLLKLKKILYFFCINPFNNGVLSC